MNARVALPADVHQIDETGYVWTLLEDARDPSQIEVGALVVAGDSLDPFLARVVDIVDGDPAVVHLDVLGAPEQIITALREGDALPE